MYELRIYDPVRALSLTFGMGSPYQIIDIDGLAPMTATINMTEIALAPGKRFENAKVNPRTINLAFAVDYDAETSRLEAYKVLRLGSRLTISYKSDLRDVTIYAYVQSVNVSHYAKKQRFTVVLICPYPFWKGHIKSVELGSVAEPLFHFPFAIEQGDPIPLGEVQDGDFFDIDNEGDVEVPIQEIALKVSGSITGITIEDMYGNVFGLTGSYQAGDTIEIMSDYNYKYILLYRNGVESNIFSHLDIGSTWLTVPVQGTKIKLGVGTGSLSSLTGTAYYQNEYEGV